MLVFIEEKFIFRVSRQEIESGGTNHVDPQVAILRVLEGCLRKLCGDAATAECGRNLGMPNSHPSGPVGFKFDIRCLAVLVNFESAPGNWGRLVVHTKKMQDRTAKIQAVAYRRCFLRSEAAEKTGGSAVLRVRKESQVSRNSD